eukprot:1159613-Pelagomonas_calceolata.AAC.8
MSVTTQYLNMQVSAAACKARKLWWLFKVPTLSLSFACPSHSYVQLTLLCLPFTLSCAGFLTVPQVAAACPAVTSLGIIDAKSLNLQPQRALAWVGLDQLCCWVKGSRLRTRIDEALKLLRSSNNLKGHIPTQYGTEKHCPVWQLASMWEGVLQQRNRAQKGCVKSSKRLPAFSDGVQALLATKPACLS